MIQSINRVFKLKLINNLLFKSLMRSKSSDVKKVIKNINYLCNQSNDKSNEKSEINPKSFERIERVFEELNVEMFCDLITNNKMRKEIEIILSEYEFEKYSTLGVPDTLTISNMKDLLLTKSSMERKRIFDFLYRKQFKRFNSKTKTKEHSIEYWAEKKKIYSERNSSRTGIWDNEGNVVYGLWHNTLFSKISPIAVKRLYVNRLRNAAMFGQKIVIDLDYDRYMTIIESRQLLKQIQYLYNYNKYRAADPFDIHFTNCNPEMPTMEAIPRFMQNYNCPSFMAPFHRKSYLDLFPKKRLVYVTPHSRETLNTYSDIDIYIIGGIVDKSCHEPVSYVKAKKEGIRTVRLPIDEHILWAKQGSKRLSLTHIFAILHDVKVSGDWKKSFIDNIPQRKQKSFQEIEYEDRLRDQKFRSKAKVVKLYTNKY